MFNTELIAALELGNMLDVAETVAQAAQRRKESRGAHTRRDLRDPERRQNYLFHQVAYFDAGGPAHRPRRK